MSDSMPPAVRVPRCCLPWARALLPAALLALGACASSATSGGAADPTAGPSMATRSMGISGVGIVQVTTTTNPDVVSLAATPDEVFRILPSVFDSLAIPVGTIDGPRRIIGNSGFRIRNRLGKTYLSTYLDCGNTQIGPNADNYDVVLTVMTTVTAEGSGARMATVVEAQAKPVTYNQAYNRCETKGSLERKLGEIVTRRVAK